MYHEIKMVSKVIFKANIFASLGPDSDANKILALKTSLQMALRKVIFKECFFRVPIPLQNQEWDPRTGEFPFS